jgi:hypothetical protein
VSRIKLVVTALALLLTLVPQSSGCLNSGRDEYYPTEEAAERNSIIWPRVMRLHGPGAALEWPDKLSRVLRIGDRYRDVELVAVIPQPAPVAVLEQDFPRWGLLGYVGTKGLVATIRKAIGRLDNLEPAKALPPQYFDRILSAQEDLLGGASSRQRGRGFLRNRGRATSAPPDLHVFGDDDIAPKGNRLAGRTAGVRRA